MDVAACDLSAAEVFERGRAELAAGLRKAADEVEAGKWDFGCLVLVNEKAGSWAKMAGSGGARPMREAFLKLHDLAALIVETVTRAQGMQGDVVRMVHQEQS